MTESIVVSAELGIPGPCKLVDDPQHQPGILVAIIQELHHQVIREEYNRNLGCQEKTWGNVTRTRFLMRTDEESAVHQAEAAKESAERRAFHAEQAQEQATHRTDSLKESLAAIKATEKRQASELAASKGRVNEEMTRNRRLETDLGKQRRDLGRIKAALGELRFNELVAAKA
jgi:hypothetical protein